MISMPDALASIVFEPSRAPSIAVWADLTDA
jgi:hypothetical protein